MLSEIKQFINWVHLRNPYARTWKDYTYDLNLFIQVVGDKAVEEITSIQKILGHKNINTTLIYARAYNQTVADDFYAAMERVEARLNIIPESAGETAPEEPENKDDEVVNVPTVKLMNWMELLSRPELGQKERLDIVDSLRQALGAPAISAAPPG